MTDFIIEITAADDALFDPVTNPKPEPSVQNGAYNDGVDKVSYLQSASSDPTGDWPASAVLLGSWDEDTGEELSVIHQNYWDFVADLGLNPDGSATGEKDTLRWQGHSEAKFADFAQQERYPAANRPFSLDIQRQDYGSTALPWDSGTTYQTGDFATSGGMWRSLQDNNLNNTPFGGSPFWEFINQSGPWGWVVIMVSDDPLRDITARAISQHSATPCNDGNFLFTTGAFIQNGNYGNRFHTECPPGNRDTVRQDVNFALRLGAGYEGWFVLPETGEDTDGLFWAADA